MGDDNQAGVIETLERVDGYAHVRNVLRHLSRERQEWAGYPMPIEGCPLVVEPRFTRAKELMAIGATGEPLEDTLPVRNSFYLPSKGCHVFILEKPNGRVTYAIAPRVHGLQMQLETLRASDVWGIEQEHNAVQLLGRLTRHRQFKQYLLTGTFLESSKRSGLTYMFRRLRPTVAISCRGTEPRIIAALCLHPIAFYSGTWGGAMCPTDDVIAHLSLMRADEAMFWKRANQHPAYVPEAGL